MIEFIPRFTRRDATKDEKLEDGIATPGDYEVLCFRWLWFGIDYAIVPKGERK